MFSRSGGAEFRSGDHDDPKVLYASGSSIDAPGAVYIDVSIRPIFIFPINSKLKESFGKRVDPFEMFPFLLSALAPQCDLR